MKLAIVGSRTFNDYSLTVYWFDWINKDLSITDIISGGANGADACGHKLATYKNLVYKEYRPDWEVYGKSAGYKRNKLIVDNCDMVLAFWDGKSKGTQHTINLAKEQKKPTFIVYF